MTIKWNKSQGIPESGEFYASAYSPLRNAIRRGNLTEGQQVYADLLKTKTPKQIDDAMKPWTGGNLNLRTLMLPTENQAVHRLGKDRARFHR